MGLRGLIHGAVRAQQSDQRFVVVLLRGEAVSTAGKSGRSSSLVAMVGAVLILLVLFLVGPFAVFVGGAVWSALTGWMVGDDADRRANAGTAGSDATSP